jgi:hypothetical protein
MTENLISKIEKPWAVYGAGGEAWDIGLIHSLSSDQKKDISFILKDNIIPRIMGYGLCSNF